MIYVQMYDFAVYLDCKNRDACGQSARSETHLRFRSKNPIKAWLVMRAARREFWQSTYYMVMERRA